MGKVIRDGHDAPEAGVKYMCNNAECDYGRIGKFILKKELKNV